MNIIVFLSKIDAKRLYSRLVGFDYTFGVMPLKLASGMNKRNKFQ